MEQMRLACGRQLAANLFAAIPASLQQGAVHRTLMQIQSSADVLEKPNAIALVGARGVGKSAAANDLLGESAAVLPSRRGASSVTLFPTRVLAGEIGRFDVGLALHAPIELALLATLQEIAAANEFVIATPFDDRVCELHHLTSISRSLSDYALRELAGAEHEQRVERLRQQYATVVRGSVVDRVYGLLRRESDPNGDATRRWLHLATAATPEATRALVERIGVCIASGSFGALGVLCTSIDVRCASAMPADMFLIDMPGWGDMPRAPRGTRQPAARRELGRLVRDARTVVMAVTERMPDVGQLLVECPEAVEAMFALPLNDYGQLFVMHYTVLQRAADERLQWRDVEQQRAELRSTFDTARTASLLYAAIQSGDVQSGSVRGNATRLLKVAQRVVNAMCVFPRGLDAVHDAVLRAALFDNVRANVLRRELERQHGQVVTLTLSVGLALQAAERLASGGGRAFQRTKLVLSNGVALTQGEFNRMLDDVSVPVWRALEVRYETELVPPLRCALLRNVAARFDVELFDDGIGDNEVAAVGALEQRVVAALNGRGVALRDVTVSAAMVRDLVVRVLIVKLAEACAVDFPALFRSNWLRRLRASPARRMTRDGSVRLGPSRGMAKVGDYEEMLTEEDTLFLSVLANRLASMAHGLDSGDDSYVSLLSRVAPTVVAAADNNNNNISGSSNRNNDGELSMAAVLNDVLPALGVGMLVELRRFVAEGRDELCQEMFGERRAVLSKAECERVKAALMDERRRSGIEPLYERLVGDRTLLGERRVRHMTRSVPPPIDSDVLLAAARAVDGAAEYDQRAFGGAPNSVALQLDMMQCDDGGVVLRSEWLTRDGVVGDGVLQQARITGMRVFVPRALRAIVDSFARVIRESVRDGVAQPQSRDGASQSDAVWLAPIVVPLLKSEPLPTVLTVRGVVVDDDNDVAEAQAIGYVAPRRLVFVVVLAADAEEIARRDAIRAYGDEMIVVALPVGCRLLMPAALEVGQLLVREWVGKRAGTEVDMCVMPPHVTQCYESSFALAKQRQVSADLVLHYMHTTMLGLRAAVIATVRDQLREMDALMDALLCVPRIEGAVHPLKLVHEFKETGALSALVRCEAAVVAAVQRNELTREQHELLGAQLFAPLHAAQRVWAVRAPGSRFAYTHFCDAENMRFFSLVKSPTSFVTPILVNALALESCTFLAQNARQRELVPTPYPPPGDSKVLALGRSFARVRAMLASDARPVLVADATLVSASWKSVPNGQAAVEASFNRERTDAQRHRRNAAAAAAAAAVDDDDDEEEEEQENEEQEEEDEQEEDDEEDDEQEEAEAEEEEELVGGMAPRTPESDEAELERERKVIFASHEYLNGAKWQLPAEQHKRIVTPTARLAAAAPLRGRMVKRQRRLNEEEEEE